MSSKDETVSFCLIHFGIILFTVIILFFTFWMSPPNFFNVYIILTRRCVQSTKDDHLLTNNDNQWRDLRRCVFFVLVILTDGRLLMISWGEISSTVAQTQYHPSQHPPAPSAYYTVTLWSHIKVLVSYLQVLLLLYRGIMWVLWLIVAAIR
jgi:hypothetical protein